MSLARSIVTLQNADRSLAGVFHVPVTGLEAVVAGALAALSKGDWWVPGMRERAGAVLRGVPESRLGDPVRGAKPYKVAPVCTSPANRALHAVGLAHASGRTTLVHLGVGSISDGAFTEALNLAALFAAPVIFLVAVHPLGGDAPVGRQSAASPSALARAYGLSVLEADGSRAESVQAAVAAARSQGGPHLVEAQLEPGADLVALAGS